MNTIIDPLLNHALIYAEQGMRVFPLHSVQDGNCSCGNATCSSMGKHPRTKNGVKEATTDFTQIKRWWNKWPRANIGIATGAGLHVIDIDSAKGASLASLADSGLDLPGQFTVRTGSGGFHIYLNCDVQLSNTVNRLGPFIDTRGEGGYVVAPPSFNKHGQYTWLRPLEKLPMPPQLLAKLQTRGSSARTLHIVSTVNTQQTLINHLENGEKTHEISSTSSNQTLQKTSSDLSSTRSAQAAAAQTPSEAMDVEREARNDFLVRAAGVFFRFGLSVPETQALLLLLNAERYGQNRHPDGPLPREEMERTVFKSLQKWEKRVRREPHAAHVASLASLMARDVPDPLVFVPGLLLEGLTLFVGKPKIGKSWLILDLGLRMAGGTAFLGKPLEQPRGVLYLALEDSESRLKKRALKLLNGQPAPEGFEYQINWEPLNAGGLDELRVWLDTHLDTGLVVIDTLAKVRTPTASKGNIYLEDYALMGQLQKLAIEYHVAIILVHHMRKMESSDIFDGASGSTGLTGGADTNMVLTRERNQSEATLSISGRDIQEQALALTFDPATCTWRSNGNAAERQTSQARQEILDLLQGHEAMTPGEIAKELKRPYAVLKTTLHRMAKDGLIEKSGHGHYSLLSVSPSPSEYSTDQAAD